MKKRIVQVLIASLCVAAMTLLATPAFAAQAGDEVYKGKSVIGKYDDKGRIVFQKQSNAQQNTAALNQLIGGDEKKTVVIPSGMTVEVCYTLRVGSNTTIIATGATILQTKDTGVGLLSNYVTKKKYSSLKNVTIEGGTWKNKINKHSATVIRFAHGQNVTLDKVKVITNYQGHAVELIAMKNVTIKNSTLKAQGKKKAGSVEEALQIDVATPLTAPGVKNEAGAKFTQGETCQNIKVINNVISGSRGVCANYASREAKYVSKFHKNITISGNTITGVTAEGLALFNTLGATVENNTIVTKNKSKSSSYAVGVRITAMGKSSAMSKASFTIKKNIIKGAKNGLAVSSKKGGKYKKITITGNKISASSGKGNALSVSKSAVKTIKASKNKLSK